jgi:CheY-like chemotaxis protein
LLGGAVCVESTLGIGSKFTVKLPRQIDRPEAFQSPRLNAALVIDDEEVARYLLKMRFRQAQHFYEATDGPNGLDVARKERPEVIFLDLNMPGMGGREVLKQIRDDPALRQTAVVIITSQPLSYADLDDLESRGAIVLSKEKMVQSSGLTIDPGPPPRISFQAYD